MHLPAGHGLVLSSDDGTLTRISRELAPCGITLRFVRHTTDAVRILVVDPPPRPQILIADFDTLSAGELLDLHAIREQGWFGTLIALGSTPPELRASLNIEHVLARPFDGKVLRRVVSATNLAQPTTKMRRVARRTR
jgi:hypothetical protein